MAKIQEDPLHSIRDANHNHTPEILNRLTLELGALQMDLNRRGHTIEVVELEGVRAAFASTLTALDALIEQKRKDVALYESDSIDNR